jgi:phospholipid transport system substrate-binding protein
VSLAKNFTSFGGEKFVTDPKVAARGAASIVKVTIQSAGRSDILQYRMRETGGDWRIVDVISEGVSNLALQRAELSGTIASDGIAGMAKKLAAKDKL